jgi:hypothetical protein
MTIILELTEAEASALLTAAGRGIRWVTPKVGSPMRAIYYALLDAGVRHTKEIGHKSFADFRFGPDA